MSNIDELQEMDRTFNEFFDITGVDNKYYIFYDESNNYRKVTIKKRKFNIANDGNFVLAGIMSFEKDTSLTFLELKRKFILMNNIGNEIKYKQVFHGDFLTVLGSSKLKILFKIINDYDFYVHFYNFNILHWGIIDIIESLLVDKNNLHGMRRNLISGLHEIAKKDKIQFIGILGEYKFPDVKDRKGFIKRLSDFIEHHYLDIEYSDDFEVTDIEILRHITKSYDERELTFVEDGDEGIFVENFLQVYINKVIGLPNAEHFFDKEDHIEKLFEDFENLFETTFPNVHFIESESDVRIQLSDLLAGFFAKYFTFIDNTQKSKLLEILDTLTVQQKENLVSLRKLLEKSDSVTQKLSLRVETLLNVKKSDIFLMYCE